MTTTTTLEQELIELEHRYWKAMRERDGRTLEQLTDFPCLVTGPQGVGRIDRETFAKMVQDPRYTIQNVKLSDVQVRPLNDDVAVVAYKVREELVVDGKPVTLEAADMSTWIRRNGTWACPAHSEALLGDSYGRDRR